MDSGILHQLSNLVQMIVRCSHDVRILVRDEIFRSRLQSDLHDFIFLDASLSHADLTLPLKQIGDSAGSSQVPMILGEDASDICRRSIFVVRGGL